MPKHTNILPAVIAARAALANTIEEIGQAMGLLREAITDATEEGNPQAAALCASDALEIIARLEATYSEITAQLAAHCA